MIRNLLFIFLILFNTSPLSSSLSDITDITKPSGNTPFLSKVDFRKKQLSGLVERFEDFKKRKADAESSVDRRINQIVVTIEELDFEIKGARKSYADLLNIRKTKLNERKQNLTTIRDAWRQTEEAYQVYIKLVERIIEELKDSKYPLETKLVYSLKDVSDVQDKVTAIASRINTEVYNKDVISRQKKTAEDSILAFQKEIDALKGKVTQSVENELELSPEALKEKTLTLEVTTNILLERKELNEINKEKLVIELESKADEILLLDMQKAGLKKASSEVQARLFVDQKDVDTAKKDYEKQKQKSLDKINQFTKVNDTKNLEYKNLKTLLDDLDAKLKELKKEGKEESVEGRILLVQHLVVDNHILLLKKYKDLYYAEKDLEENKILLKEVISKIVEIRYKIQTEDVKELFEQWLIEFNKINQSEDDGINALEDRRTEISNYLSEIPRKIEDFTLRIEKLKKEKAIFKGDLDAIANSETSLKESINYLKESTKLAQQQLLVISEVILYKKDVITQAKYIIKELETRKEFDIWKRSVKAITIKELINSISNAADLIKFVFWRIPEVFNPYAILSLLKQFVIYDYIGLFLLGLLFCIFILAIFWGLSFANRELEKSLLKCGKGGFCLVIKIVAAFTKITLEHYRLFAIWLFIQLDILFNFKQFFGVFGDFISYTDSDYLIAYFYLFSIGILLFLSRRFIICFQELNKKYGYMFLSEVLEESYKSLLKLFFYISSVVIPLAQAFYLLAPKAPQLPSVLYAAYIIILQGIVVTLVLIHKENILRLLQVKTESLIWIKELFSKYYVPTILFIFGLLVLSNPYVGYFNFAFHLLYAIPLSAFSIYVLIEFHGRLRKFLTVWFMSEEDDEYVERFDYAKTYYGITILFTFLLFFGVTVLLLAKIWGVTSAWELMVDLIQDKWTLDVAGKKLGFIQFIIFILFIAGGFVVSTIMEKFFLVKAFDVLRMDFGVRNAIASIVHYIIIYLSIVLGLSAIYLNDIMWWVSGAVAVGVGFSAKDFIADLIAGFLILIERPIEIGSFIEFDNIIGTVFKISPRSTAIRNALNQMLIIPNREILGKIITNWTYSKAHVGFDIDIIIAYNSDPEKVKELIMQILQEEHRVLRNPATIYRVENLEDRGFMFKVRCFISARRAREKWDVSSDIRKSILILFKQNNISISFPQMAIYPRTKKGFGEYPDDFIYVKLNEKDQQK